MLVFDIGLWKIWICIVACLCYATHVVELLWFGNAYELLVLVDV